MKKVTLKFTSLNDIARFAKITQVGYLMNTINFTLTGKFPATEIEIATDNYNAWIIATTELVYSYK